MTKSFFSLALALLCTAPLAAQRIDKAERIGNHAAEISFSSGRRLTVDFYGDNIVRLFCDPTGGPLRDPAAEPPATILVVNPRKAVKSLELGQTDKVVTLTTPAMRLSFDRATGCLTATDCRTGRTVLSETEAPKIGKKRTTLTLAIGPNEYFYGGGVQNGRFSHRGQKIMIENSNNWVDGGVASPCPFYWSTAGYGLMPYTFKKGSYDFGAAEGGKALIEHETDYLDYFLMVDSEPAALLRDFYQLTGAPVLLPKFGFYEGHLNAYNRDYFKPAENGPLRYEDGRYYSESSKPSEGAVKESLNGEKNNYMFSARAALDRYRTHDMPLGWFLPNDGYGAGYGQDSTLDGNIENLRLFGDYARSHGVQIGLWTQSDLHPKPGIEALLQRDINKEIGTAGVRVLKTDVAWVGAGYSFGLHGISDVAQIMREQGSDARPFIISLDGWAGTQRYAGIWSGDQTGGQWEYIRFHIPTFIGSGLSGQPNITSDVDGIFGGKNPIVNMREFQWKTFTPMELNMDGWGSSAKYPHALGEPATSINRMYLKLKSELMPYTYSIAREAVSGLPMMRAMFLDDANPYTLGPATRYQFMYGPYLLVAPVYQNTAADTLGNDHRDGIYLPAGRWIDYMSGDIYEGGRIVNSFPAPIWKLPVLVKAGAIIPMTNPNNNPGEIRRDYRAYELYPAGETSFTEYDDDGLTLRYEQGQEAFTPLHLSQTGDKVEFSIEPTSGRFEGMEPMKQTEIRVNVSQAPKRIVARYGGKKLKLHRAKSLEEFEQGENLYYYLAQPRLNRFATAGTPMAAAQLTKNPQFLVKTAALDVTAAPLSFSLTGFVFAPTDTLLQRHGRLTPPAAIVQGEGVQPKSLTPSWPAQADADYYEVEFGGMNYSNIRQTSLLFDELKPETEYTFKVRAVNADGTSTWTTLTASTTKDPLEFALRGLRAEATCASQGGQGLQRLFNFDEGDTWHSAWGKQATPCDLTIDLGVITQLDKMVYVPRPDQGNGTFVKGNVSYSLDKTEWSEPVSFDWSQTAPRHTFAFASAPTARYLRIHLDEGRGGYASGNQLYVMRQEGADVLVPGDVNRDKVVDENDLTSYANYTGLRRGDADFDYVSIGDLNRNGLIDAYDISNVATRLDGGAYARRDEPALAGKLSFAAARTSYRKGDDIVITCTGSGLQAVNALSAALPYDAADMTFVSIEPIGMAQMRNLTNNRLHTDGSHVLYPTFVNIGNAPTLSGDVTLFRVHFKANRNFKLRLNPTNLLLVDKRLNQLQP